jgi:hypothetical protein
MCYGTASRTGRLNHLVNEALTPAHKDSDPSLSFLLIGFYAAPLASDPMKLFRARFNQRQATPDSALRPNPVGHYASCDCLGPQYDRLRWPELKLHCEVQDTSSDGWAALEQYIAEVAASGTDELNPIEAIGPERWERIVTLPRSIQNLKSVRFLSPYGSHLVRIPPEIGEMTSLEEFDPYTSYSLHWFSYQITHCRQLKQSRVSTQALYGNYKYRPPFPQLPVVVGDVTPCGLQSLRRSLQPKLDRIKPGYCCLSLAAVHHPTTEPTSGYTEKPHTGGLQIRQPPARLI